MTLPLITFKESPNNRFIASMVWPPGMRSRPVKQSIQRELIDPALDGTSAPVIVYHVRVEASGLRLAILKRLLPALGYSVVSEAPSIPRVPWRR